MICGNAQYYKGGKKVTEVWEIKPQVLFLVNKSTVFLLLKFYPQFLTVFYENQTMANVFSNCC